MGELASDAADGALCSWCGVYFNGAHGYPVVCQSCAKDSTPRELTKLGLQIATRSEL